MASVDFVLEKGDRFMARRTMWTVLDFDYDVTSTVLAIDDCGNSAVIFLNEIIGLTFSN